MTLIGLSESVIEQAALTWLEELGFAVKHGPEIATAEFGTERIVGGHS